MPSDCSDWKNDLLAQAEVEKAARIAAEISAEEARRAEIISERAPDISRRTGIPVHMLQFHTDYYKYLTHYYEFRACGIRFRSCRIGRRYIRCQIRRDGPFGVWRSANNAEETAEALRKIGLVL